MFWFLCRTNRARRSYVSGKCWSYVLVAGYPNSKPASLSKKFFANIMFVTCYSVAACLIQWLIRTICKVKDLISNNKQWYISCKLQDQLNIQYQFWQDGYWSIVECLATFPVLASEIMWFVTEAMEFGEK